MDNNEIQNKINAEAQEKYEGKRIAYERVMLERALKHFKIEEVPEDANKRFKMSNWGRRKRDNYHNLVADGLTKDEAYAMVEYGGKLASH